MISLAPLTLILAALALSPLTPDQRAQLDTAQDRSPTLDEGALYPLLQNALTQGTQGEPASAGGSPPPADYDALLAHPAAHRGQPVRIEGRFARARRFDLARPGPWGDALTEWVILVRDDPQEVAVVYFVDPDHALPTPRVGQRIQTVARFYKLWGDRDMQGNPATYLTFVARSARVIAASPGDTTAPTNLAWLLVPLVIALLGGFVLVRYLLRRPRPRPHRSADHSIPTPPPPSLPQDPAEALDHLRNQR